jgi:aryl-alcohol dehydrogenase-like predicted oxidoreductase
MEDLACQGKILYWGVSEWPTWLLVKAIYVAKELGARLPVVNELRYNLLYRYPETETFPVSRHEGIGSIVYSPLAQGLLTGKYKPGQPAPPGTRAADPEHNAILMKLFWSEENKRKGQELRLIAADMGTTAARLAIAWAMRHPAVTCVILGARTVVQMKENLGALEVKVTAEAVESLEALYPLPAGPPQA